MKIRINASESYDVLIERGLLKNIGNKASEYIPPCNALIITDDNVDKLYADICETSLKDAGYNVHKFVFTHGEESKTIDTFADILNYMAELKMTRKDVIFALGGGITGDISGFAAATYLRGIKFIQIPTTLLAAVDSSVGGKTGINLKSGKNLAGAFHQPSAVFCDPDTFKTLPEDIFSDGVSEAIKSSIINVPSLFEKFEDGTFSDEIDSVTESCIRMKGYIVENDEFESGMRRLLNLGHTAGHAIEKCSNYEISHGHAVSIGMAIVSRAAEKSGLCEIGLSDKIINTLKKCNLPTSCKYNAKELTEVMLNDKKRIKNSVTFVVPQKIGSCIMHDVDVDDICRFISLGLEEI